MIVDHWRASDGKTIYLMLNMFPDRLTGGRSMRGGPPENGGPKGEDTFNWGIGQVLRGHQLKS